MHNTTAAATVDLKDDGPTRCEVWTRVMGCHRPVSAYNAGKQSEHAERRCYRESRATIG